MLSLMRRLREAPRDGAASIARFDDFVARVAFNAANDALRDRFPRRARLKNQIRYALTHEGRFALWRTASGMTAGDARSLGREPAAASVFVEVTSEDLTETLAAVFEAAGGPMLLDALVETVSRLWGIEEARHVAVEEAVNAALPAIASIEQRGYLVTLWNEIRGLRANQRAALLLNLRDSEGLSAIELFVLLGLATIDDIAEALEMPAARLAGIWNTLPLDDLTIAGMLGVKRQQVINLRRAARDRLGRRMKMR